MNKTIPESDLILNDDGSIYHLNLRPEHLASSVITVGDPDRVSKVSDYFNHIEIKISKREFLTHTGTYKGKRLSVVSSGIGTDNVEILMTELDALVNINFQTRVQKKQTTSLNIIRVGTSGSMQANIPAGSLVASRYGIGLDTLMTFYNCPYTQKEYQVGDEIKKALSLPFRPYCVKGSSFLLERMARI